MPTFNDLPKDVRDRIYRLHLCYDEPIGSDKHSEIIKYKYRARHSNKFMPPIMTLSKQMEKEAAPFYYSENIFDSKNSWDLGSICSDTWPRHVKLIRKVAVTWDDRTNGASYLFDQVRRLKGLEELYVRTDEREMVLKSLRNRKKNDRFAWQNPDPTPQ